MAKNIQGLTKALKEFQEQLQSNSDAIGDLIDQRETTRKAPANQVDVFGRIENAIKEMSKSYLRNHQHDIQRLRSYQEFNASSLFTKTAKVDGVTITMFDPDVLAFFNQESLLIAAKAMSEEVTLSSAGLPFGEREKAIHAINEKIAVLEDEDEALRMQASKAGLVVSEEYAVL